MPAGDLHTPHLVWHEQPIVITIVDSAESIARLVPAVEEMMHTGVDRGTGRPRYARREKQPRP